MLEIEEVPITRKEVVKFICDKCKKEFGPEDWIDWQETYSIRVGGGYGSVFGDGSQIECDLCQHCLKEILKGIYRHKDYSEDYEDYEDED